MFLRLITMLALLLAAPIPSASAAEGDGIEQSLAALAQGDYDAKAEAIEALAATGHPAVEAVLAAMRAGDLHLRKEDGKIVIGQANGREVDISDPVTGEALGTVGKRDLTKVRVNNRLRRTIDAALSGLTLLSPDRDKRLVSAATMFESGTPDDLPAVEAALAAETDEEVAAAFEIAIGAITLRDADSDEAARLEAVDTIAAIGTRDATALLASTAAGEGPVAEKAARAMGRIEQQLKLWQAGQNIAYGLSLGSALLLAAIGLAITFGVMGVINLAHGEMVMIGAYTTFVIQEAIRTSAPWLFDVSLFIAIPAAFLVAGAVGVAIERGVIRFLYGRPLETLLATWGISLMLQQAVRSIFGPTNREVGNPSWMSGSVEIGQIALTWNRIWIFVFAIVVFAGLMALLRKSRFGLHTRAVTQNREMASAMGIRTGRVDALTFGLGSGIAGLAGVALSQIDNVSPNLGQGYIIDSFLVVVFGGVGNLWGTLTGAMTLGIVNKFLEPYAGAVLGKILVLVFIILFIQKRPRGLFAQRGRAVEA